MPPVSAPPKKRRLGELLIEAGVLDEERLKAALQEQRKWGGKLGRTLVELGYVDEESMCKALSKQLQINIFDLDSASLPGTVVQLLQVHLAERYGVFPVGGDPRMKLLEIATSDPTNGEALHDLSLATGCRVKPAVATGSAIDRAIRRYYYGEGAPVPGAAGAAAVPTVPTGAERGGAGAPVRPPPPPAASIDLDELMGASSPAPRALPAAPPSAAPQAVVGQQPPPPPPPSSPMPRSSPAAAGGDDAVLRRELTLLREQVDSLEKVAAGQVRSLRALVELLIESGLIARDEYLAKMHKGD